MVVIKKSTLKNLSKIIHARVTEIIESVWQSQNWLGSKKKLIAGVVLTGGGSQLKHLKQLVGYITEWIRDGVSNEHLAGDELQNLLLVQCSQQLLVVMKAVEQMSIEEIEDETDDEECQLAMLQSIVK